MARAVPVECNCAGEVGHESPDQNWTNSMTKENKNVAPSPKQPLNGQGVLGISWSDGPMAKTSCNNKEMVPANNDALVDDICLNKDDSGIVSSVNAKATDVVDNKACTI